MKPFDLERAKAGCKIITRSGCHARIICFDHTCGNGMYAILALVKTDYKYESKLECIDEKILSYTSEGRYNNDIPKHPLDLFMAIDKKQGWINIYKSHIVAGIGGSGHIHETEGKAISKAKTEDEDYIGTFKIEWEE